MVNGKWWMSPYLIKLWLRTTKHRVLRLSFSSPLKFNKISVFKHQEQSVQGIHSGTQHCVLCNVKRLWTFWHHKLIAHIVVHGHVTRFILVALREAKPSRLGLKVLLNVSAADTHGNCQVHDWHCVTANGKKVSLLKRGITAQHNRPLMHWITTINIKPPLDFCMRTLVHLYTIYTQRLTYCHYYRFVVFQFSLQEFSFSFFFFASTRTRHRSTLGLTLAFFVEIVVVVAL